MARPSTPRWLSAALAACHTGNQLRRRRNRHLAWRLRRSLPRRRRRRSLLALLRRQTTWRSSPPSLPCCLRIERDRLSLRTTSCPPTSGHRRPDCVLLDSLSARAAGREIGPPKKADDAASSSNDAMDPAQRTTFARSAAGRLARVRGPRRRMRRHATSVPGRPRIHRRFPRHRQRLLRTRSRSSCSSGLRASLHRVPPPRHGRRSRARFRRGRGLAGPRLHNSEAQGSRCGRCLLQSSGCCSLLYF